MRGARFRCLPTFRTREQREFYSRHAYHRSVLRRSLGLVTLFTLLACTPAQPAKAPASAASPAPSAPEAPDEIAVAAEGDPNLELALREAVSLERERAVAPQRKAAAWQAVVDLAGERAIGEIAATRVREWSLVTEVEERRPETLRALRTAYEEKVFRLHSGETNLKEFCDGFRPHARDLEELKVTPPFATFCR